MLTSSTTPKRHEEFEHEPSSTAELMFTA